MHHIQKTIIYKLAFAKSQTFSQLKNPEIENKLFDYHLKQTVRDGFVEKLEVGYALTPDGRKIAPGLAYRESEKSVKAYSIIFTIIKHAETGEYLLAKRLSHPLIGGIGLVHHLPSALTSILETAKLSTLSKTGLNADYKHHASGYFRVFNNDLLESFIHFDLLVCKKATGELKSNDKRQEFLWTKDLAEACALPDALPTLQHLVSLAKGPVNQFLEVSIETRH
jgi:hypothetical protein